jgi:hypothetical protein
MEIFGAITDNQHGKSADQLERGVVAVTSLMLMAHAGAACFCRTRLRIL